MVSIPYWVSTNLRFSGRQVICRLSAGDKWYDVNLIAVAKLGIHTVFITNMFAVYKYRQGAAKLPVAIAPACVYFGMAFPGRPENRLKANGACFCKLRK